MRRWKRRRPPVALPVAVEPPPPWDFDDLAARVLGEAAQDRKRGVEKLLDAAEHGWQACPPPVAAEQAWPRLSVRRPTGSSVWWWSVSSADGILLKKRCAMTHAEALAVGLANLAVYTAAWAIDVHGTELPTGWEKITP